MEQQNVPSSSKELLSVSFAKYPNEEEVELLKHIALDFQQSQCEFRCSFVVTVRARLNF